MIGCFISERCAVIREELSFPGQGEIEAANSGFSKCLFLWLSDVVGTVNTELMDILWQSYYCNSSTLAIFSNSPLLCASNTKCAKMYSLWRGILGEKSGGTEAFRKTDR